MKKQKLLTNCLNCNNKFLAFDKRNVFCCSQCKREYYRKIGKADEVVKQRALNVNNNKHCRYCGTKYNLRTINTSTFGKVIYNVCLNCYEKHDKNRLKQLRKNGTIEKYGVNNISQLQSIKNKKIIKMKKIGKFHPFYSDISQELFSELKKYLSYDNIYYAENGGEYCVQTIDGKIRFLDFYICESNKWIEFDEPHHKWREREDKIREKEIFKTIPTIKLLRINEQQYLNDKHKIINECLEFLGN